MNTTGTGAAVILQQVSLGADLDDQLAQRFRVIRSWDGSAPDPAACSHARVVITSTRKGCSARAMAQLPGLQAICSWGVGYDTIDIGAARRSNIVVSNTPDVLNDCVADMAWALLLGVTRRLHLADRYVRTGQWRTLGNFPLTRRVWGKQLGILGLGRIGEAIALRGTGFGMTVRYTNRRTVAQSPYTFEPSLLALADWADFLVVACPGGPETTHLVSEAVMRALGPQGVLINIARGTVVDQAAMIRLLHEGGLGAAGLDVVEGEPGVPDALRSMDNVLITPHIASATHETRRAMAELVMHNAVSFLETGRLLTPIEEAEAKARPQGRH